MMGQAGHGGWGGLGLGRGGEGLGLGLVSCKPPPPPPGPGAKPASHSGGGGLGSRGQHCGSGCNVEPGPPSSRPVLSSGDHRAQPWDPGDPRGLARVGEDS